MTINACLSSYSSKPRWNIRCLSWNPGDGCTGALCLCQPVPTLHERGSYLRALLCWHQVFHSLSSSLLCHGTFFVLFLVYFLHIFIIISKTLKISWKMLTLARPTSKVDEDIFSKLVLLSIMCIIIIINMMIMVMLVIIIMTRLVDWDWSLMNTMCWSWSLAMLIIEWTKHINNLDHHEWWS